MISASSASGAVLTLVLMTCSRPPPATSRSESRWVHSASASSRTIGASCELVERRNQGSTKTSAGITSAVNGMPVNSQAAGAPTPASSSWIRRCRTMSGSGAPTLPYQAVRNRSAVALGLSGADSGRPVMNRTRQARPVARAVPQSRYSIIA